MLERWQKRTVLSNDVIEGFWSRYSCLYKRYKQGLPKPTREGSAQWHPQVWGSVLTALSPRVQRWAPGKLEKVDIWVGLPEKRYALWWIDTAKLWPPSKESCCDTDTPATLTLSDLIQYQGFSLAWSTGKSQRPRQLNGVMHRGQPWTRTRTTSRTIWQLGLMKSRLDHFFFSLTLKSNHQNRKID